MGYDDAASDPYYGDEIGMRSLVDMPNVEGANHNGKERAGARTPMQWTADETAGFSDCTPDKLYLPVCTDWTPATSLPQYTEWKKELASGKAKPIAKGNPTVESQENDPESILNWTRALISLRKTARPYGPTAVSSRFSTRNSLTRWYISAATARRPS